MGTGRSGVAWVPVLVVLAALPAVYRPILVTGSSMEPAMSWGDVCLVARPSTLRAGDIALFEGPGAAPVLHRVVSVRGDGALVTRGDANPSADLDPVAARSVMGKVVVVLRTGKACSALRSAAAACARISAQSHRQRR